MTPDKQAASLVLKHLGWVNSNMEYAKQCALITAEEIKENLLKELSNDDSAVHAIYWEKVKEIIKEL